MSAIKSFLRNYGHRPKIDQDIQKFVKSCTSCALAVKLAPANYQPWPKTDKPWSMLLVDHTGPFYNAYYSK